MIRRLKTRFVLLAGAALLVLLTVIVVGMNLISYHSVAEEADRILSVLSQNKGAFPPDTGGEPGGRFPHNLSPETPFESRFFSVLLDNDGEVLSTDTTRIASVNDAQAAEYAASVRTLGDTQGFAGVFRYVRRQEYDGERIVFLDCGRSLDSFHDFLAASAGMALAGFVIVFLVIFILSGRILRPISESYEKQKRFITDAGHEIKTPLTIIGANVDILKMELGENESLSDIAQQTKRLADLTQELVLLSRMDESERSLQKIEFPVSEVVTEAVQPFRKLAAQQEKQLDCALEPLLTLKGNDRAIRELVTLLLDNAMKYSPAGGRISVGLSRQGRTIALSVFNTTEAELRQDQLVHVFDRFYRTDDSRNSETGGHGIGLSVAQAIVAAHGGKISASTEDGRSFRIVAVLPA